jgi:hypothetical protein
MTNNNLFRTAGWSALAGAIIMVVAMVSFMLAPMLGGILEFLFLLLLIYIFCALYVVHRSESKGLSLAGLVLLVAAVVADVISMQNYGNTFLSNLWYLLFSFPFLIFGFLAWRSDRMPRGLAVLALLAGATYFISAVGGLLGSQAIAEGVSTLSILFVLVWLVWLWQVFLSKKFAVALVVPACA